MRNHVSNTLVLNSREVAKMLPKRHTDLLRDIEIYNGYFSQNAKLRSDSFWKKSSYNAGTGKCYKCYLITKKGCEFLAHKMTGKKGTLFTATYINRFHKMEEQLHQPAPVSSSPHEVVTKMYDGRYVLTIADIARLTGVSGGLICYFIRGKLPSPLRINIDYFFLEGMLTRAYKQQNALVPKSTSVLIVVTKSGFVKICKQFNIGNALRLFNSAMPGMNVSITKPTVPAVKKPHQLYTIQQRIMKADVITRLLQTAVDNVEKVFMRMSAMELIFGNSYNQLLDIVRAGMDLKKELKPLSRKDRAYVQKGVHESVPYKSLTKNLQNFVDKSFA